MTYACTEQWTSVIYQLPPFGKVVFLRIRRPLGIWKFNFHNFLAWNMLVIGFGPQVEETPYKIQRDLSITFGKVLICLS